MSLDPEGNSGVNLCVLDTNTWQAGMVEDLHSNHKQTKIWRPPQHLTVRVCVCVLIIVKRSA